MLPSKSTVRHFGAIVRTIAHSCAARVTLVDVCLSVCVYIGYGESHGKQTLHMDE